MEARENTIVPLGYGKFARADRIVALEPIEDDRGPGRRTRVFVEQLSNPIIASRTETSIVANMVKAPRETMEATAAMELLEDILDDMRHVGPMLRKSIKKEAQLDLDRIEKRIEELLKHEIDFDLKQ